MKIMFQHENKHAKECLDDVYVYKVLIHYRYFALVRKKKKLFYDD